MPEIARINLMNQSMISDIPDDDTELFFSHSELQQLLELQKHLAKLIFSSDFNYDFMLPIPPDHDVENDDFEDFSEPLQP